jgi:nitroimidazol reductase NimA-like FMN-containing flavoprotein (pyridoxamine 5'-phosphate oxidase superfamily)
MERRREVHAVRDDRSHELTGIECMKLLAQRHLGRVAVVADDGPAVYPVSYAVGRDTVVFRTDEPPRLGRDGQVALQVDDLSETRDAGWSVVVRGQASELREPGELEEARRLRPQAPDAPGHYIRLRQVSVTGRRIEASPGVQEQRTGDLPSNWLG